MVLRSTRDKVCAKKKKEINPFIPSLRLPPLRVSLSPSLPISQCSHCISTYPPPHLLALAHQAGSSQTPRVSALWSRASGWPGARIVPGCVLSELIFVGGDEEDASSSSSSSSSSLSAFAGSPPVESRVASLD